MNGARTLNYILDNVAEFPFSSNPLDSDLSQNLLLMEQLVGTLVKYSGVGRYEGYFAEKWEISKDKLRWIFYLKEDLFDEYNTKITPKEFIASLERSLKIYNLQSTPPVFQNLIGFHEFATGKKDNISGLSMGEDNSLFFNFLKPPNGLLEYLSMPYYGYFNSKNYNESGKWRDNFSIISSGAYSITNWMHKKQITLHKRNVSGQKNSSSPQEVIIKFLPTINFSEPQSNSLYFSKSALQYTNRHKSFREIYGTPNILITLILSPYIDGIFKNGNNRNYIKTRFNQERQKIISKNNQVHVFQPQMYTQFSTILSPQTNDLIDFKRDKEIIQIAIHNNFDQKVQEIVEKSIYNVFNSLDIPYKYIDVKNEDSHWRENVQSNSKYHARIARVDIGGYPEDWLIQMMFCSKLGVSFPDPSKSICSLINDYQHDSRISESQYIEELGRLIDKDSTIIPLLHTRKFWLASDNLDFSNIGPTMSHPIFEKIILK